EAFKGRDLTKSWNWLVQATSKITKNDFKILTGQSKNTSFSSAVTDLSGAHSECQSLIAVEEFKSRLAPNTTVGPLYSSPIKPLSFVEDCVDDSDIGPLWAKHFPRIADNVGSKLIVLALVYIIEDRTNKRTAEGDWSNRVSQQLRRYG